MSNDPNRATWHLSPSPIFSHSSRTDDRPPTRPRFAATRSLSLTRCRNCPAPTTGGFKLNQILPLWLSQYLRRRPSRVFRVYLPFAVQGAADPPPRYCSTSAGVSVRPAVAQAIWIRSFSCSRQRRTVPSYAPDTSQRPSGVKPRWGTEPSWPRNTTGAAPGASGRHRRIVWSSLAVASHWLSGLKSAATMRPTCPFRRTASDVAGARRSKKAAVWSHDAKATHRLSGLKTARITRSSKSISLISFGGAPGGSSHNRPFWSMLAVAAQRPSPLSEI